jgi:hypothetical protein
MGQDREQNLKPTTIIPALRLINLELAFYHKTWFSLEQNTHQAHQMLS